MRQFGFSEGKGTVGAIAELMSIAKEARRGTYVMREICAVLMIDVRSAF